MFDVADCLVTMWAGQGAGLVLLAMLVPGQPSSLGGSPLYEPGDQIVLLNNTNFQPTVCGSQRAWLVEFYSSWWEFSPDDRKRDKCKATCPQ